MKPKGLSLLTHLQLLAPYIGRTVLLVLPMLAAQIAVPVGLVALLRSNASQTGKILFFLVILVYGEVLVFYIWTLMQETLVENIVSYSKYRKDIARNTKKERLIQELRRNDRNEEVRAEAIRKDLGARMLFDIALNEVSSCVRVSAAVEIDEPNDAEALLRASNDPRVRKCMLWKIRNETLLGEYALNDGSEEVRVKAVEFIRQPEELETLLRASGDPKVREIAASKVKSEALLREVALSDPGFDVRIAAAKNIESPDILQEIIADTDSVSLWRLCLPKLIRNSKVDGIIPESIRASLRKAKHAEKLLDLQVCPDCGGEVYHHEEIRDVDPDNISEYDDDPILVEHWRFYTCKGCGREEATGFGIYDPGFSVSLGSLLTENSKN